MYHLVTLGLKHISRAYGNSVYHINLLSYLYQQNKMIKILGKGKLTKKLEVKAHAFSDKAKEAIEALGGVASII